MDAYYTINKLDLQIYLQTQNKKRLLINTLCNAVVSAPLNAIGGDISLIFLNILGDLPRRNNLFYLSEK